MRAPARRVLTSINSTAAAGVSRSWLTQITADGRHTTSMGNPARLSRRIDPQATMAIPISVTFRGMDVSEALRAKIEARARRLDRFAEDILACNVVVSASGRRHQHGNRYDVRAAVTLRDRTIEAGHTPTPDSSHADAYLAVTHTFDTLRRRIEDHVRRRRGDVKSHAVAE